ncbi:YifB family Mg chelatase-like AAA ATPase [Elongatibacter sediminis]|uniref:YifB family Mg chelatase-like AAA ATPase n=1 Tax=Elongatibacter sediminis TaxID=3119006 RepID=A0AAW9R901_9GAMM
MNLAQVYSRGSRGVDAPEVVVEVHIGHGLPSVTLVGLPATAVRESRDRVKAAILNSGFEFTQWKVTVSLAPADLPKEGSRFDLPIALGILAASGQVPAERMDGVEFIGELSLSGAVKPVRGVLPAAMRAGCDGRVLIIPEGNSAEAALAEGTRAHGAACLSDVAAWLHGKGDLEPVRRVEPVNDYPHADLSDVVGQPRARRALEVAAAGGHNLLFTGSPGTGKTLLASRLPGILPIMDDAEALEVAAVSSLSLGGVDLRHWRMRPFRAPHHTASAAALVGGGTRPRPGEISLAHHGVLFLDELPEFSRHVLEVLREPMESGKIAISRANAREVFPASFQLVAAMNPCPCGHAGDASGRCHCTGEQIDRYRARISGPLLDRIDLQVEVPRPEAFLAECESATPEPSAPVRERVIAARALQQERAGRLNARLDFDDLKRHCQLQPDSKNLLAAAAEKQTLSPRACHRILKVARTLADLDKAEHIDVPHLAEAISYRSAAAHSQPQYGA